MGVKDALFGSGMDTMKRKLVGSALRWALTGTGFIVASQSDTGDLDQMAGALITIGTLGWSMWEKRQARRETVQALSVAQISENEVKALVANPVIPTPSVFTPPNVVPVPVR